VTVVLEWTSLVTSLWTSYAADVGLGVIEVLGIERRRRWPDAVKLSILTEVNTDGWTLSDVAWRALPYDRTIVVQPVLTRQAWFEGRALLAGMRSAAR